MFGFKIVRKDYLTYLKNNEDYWKGNFFKIAKSRDEFMIENHQLKRRIDKLLQLGQDRIKRRGLFKDKNGKWRNANGTFAKVNRHANIR